MILHFAAYMRLKQQVAYIKTLNAEASFLWGAEEKAQFHLEKT